MRFFDILTNAMAMVSLANPLPVQERDGIESLGSAAALNGILLVQDCTGLRSVVIQVIDAGVGCTLTPEVSNDGITWYGVVGYDPASTGTTASTLTAVSMRLFPCTARWFRIRCSVYGSGTPTVRALFRSEPIPRIATAVSASIGNAGSASPTTETSTALGASATFTGSSRDSGSTPTYSRFVANVYADQASAANGARIEKSQDGTTWRPAAVATLIAGVPVELSVICTARYHRCILVNGATAQGACLITSAYHRN